MPLSSTADEWTHTSTSSSSALPKQSTTVTSVSMEHIKDHASSTFVKELHRPSAGAITTTITNTSAGEGTAAATTTTGTTSVSRSYSHLDYTTFMTSGFFLCAIRTAVQQPLNIALLRKQSAPGFQSKSTTTILRHIYKNEGGIRAVLRGMPALTLGCASSEVVYLALLEYGREQLPFDSAATRAACAGYLSDGACRLLHIPLSIIAYRQMSQGIALGNKLMGGTSSTASNRSCSTSTPTLTTTSTTSSSSAGGSSSPRIVASSPLKRPPPTLAVLNSFQTLQQMYRERGLRTVFAGLGTTLMVGTQWSAVWWPLYGAIKESLYHCATPMLQQLPPNRVADSSRVVSSSSLSSLPSSSISPPSTRTTSGDRTSSSGIWAYIPTSLTDPVDNAVVCTVASAVTSASTAVIFNPFLVIRTNLQVKPGASLWSVCKGIYWERGFRGFYSGLYLSIMTCVLDGALASLSYEYARLWADKTRWTAST